MLSPMTWQIHQPALLLKKGGLYARRENRRRSGEGDFAESTTEPRRRPEDGNLFPVEFNIAGRRSNRYGHVLVSCPAGWNIVWRGPRYRYGQGGGSGHVDRPRCRYDQEGRCC